MTDNNQQTICLPIVNWLKDWFTTTDDLIDVVYPVGSIYMSVSNVDPSELFGGVWEQIEDTFLLSSGSTYTATYDNDGFADATGGEATHTLSSSEMPSHTHEQNSHNHTQNGHTHPVNGRTFLTATGNIAVNGTKRSFPSSASDGHHFVYSDSSNASIEEWNTTSSTTATNQSATATNKNSGGGQAHNNMPPYLIVNVWKRIE